MPQLRDPKEMMAIIEEEKNTLAAFVEILKTEEAALIQGQIDKIERLASDKSQLVERLENLNKMRVHYLSSSGFSPDKQGMHLWLSKQALNNDVQAIWTELVILAKCAQQINKSNSKIVSTQLLHNQRAYIALQGAAGNFSLYGPKGQPFV